MTGGKFVKPFSQKLQSNSNILELFEAMLVLHQLEITVIEIFNALIC